jgi:imidazole glycerol-phosphate synthase subunit HisH
LKVPHVGWNTIQKLNGPLFRGIIENSFVYYVHSFYAEKGAETIAKTNYINPFSASLSKNNFHAVQFHPEKSGVVGETILKNFIQL